MDKLFFKLSILSLLTITTFFSCNKEEFQNEINQSNAETDLLQTNQFTLPTIKLISYNDGIRLKTNLLEFESIEDYENTINHLRSNLKQNLTDFNNRYGNLNEEDFNLMSDKLGFDEFSNLIDFEKQFRFTNSMRKAYTEAENIWLDNRTLDFENHPSKIYGYGMAEMTLLNENGEIKIGNSILKFTYDGYIEITDGNFETLVSFNNGDVRVLENQNIESGLGSNNRSACDNWENQHGYNQYDPGVAYVTFTASFHSYPWKGTTSGELRSYKWRKRWGKWKWRRTKINCAAAVQGITKDVDCSNAQFSAWSGFDYEYSSFVDNRVTSWGAFSQHRIENLTNYAEFKFAGFTTILYIETL